MKYSHRKTGPTSKVVTAMRNARRIRHLALVAMGTGARARSSKGRPSSAASGDAAGSTSARHRRRGPPRDGPPRPRGTERPAPRSAPGAHAREYSAFDQEKRMKRNACTDGCGPARHGHRPNVPQQGLRGGCQGYLEAAAPSVQYRTITTDGLSVQLHIIRAHVASERRGASLPHHIDLPHALPLPVRTAPAQKCEPASARN